MTVTVDPRAVQATAGPLITLAYDVGTVARTLDSDIAACAQACGDAGLAEGVHAFAARLDGGVVELSRAIDLLGQVLVAVAAAYRETDAGAMPAGPGG
jgi:uncharacterized protein YukE